MHPTRFSVSLIESLRGIAVVSGRVMPGVRLLLSGYEKGSMKIRKSKSGALIAGGYLLPTFVVASPLIRDGYIGHGNGVEFLFAMVLTSPLSPICWFPLNRLIFPPGVNSFYMTGWPYFITLCELGAGALLNAGLIYMVVIFIQRKWQRA